MARLRSPGYPNFPLAHVIEFARKIHDEDRQHPVAREVAAKHMGFSGVTGASDRALSALFHYDLAEKAAKGEIRITELALKIIHSETPEERRDALRRAAFAPELFRQLRDRYPSSPPSLGSLQSYLSRENFAPAAIPAASRAYLETCEFLMRERAYDSDLDSGEPRAEPPPHALSRPETSAQTNHDVHHSTPTGSLARAPISSLREDTFSVGDEGEIIARLPNTLSQEMYDDLKDFLDLLARKARRKVAAPSQPDAEAPAEGGPKES